VTLPADSHVHSQWSYDAPGGAMEETCERAVALGLPAVAFTEHADQTRSQVAVGGLDDYPFLLQHVVDGVFVPPSLDVDGYFQSLERCRARFPDLRIVSGVELGEPHWHADAAAALLTTGEFDRVLGSLHCLPASARSPDVFEVSSLYGEGDPGEVIRAYLAEIPRLVHGFGDFAVLAHIDYAVRDWPAGEDAFDPAPFEEEFRVALQALAATGRALEVNTSGPMNVELVQWWHDVGGDAVSFGSDAHDPAAVGRRFADAAALVEACGFRPGRHPFDFWVRSA
jgi:histidinol-phosphatase (PHP family)